MTRPGFEPGPPRWEVGAAPLLALNGQNISFLNSVKYLGVIFDKKVKWILHIDMIEAKAKSHGTNLKKKKYN
jgi:hypothetical protein